jgi:hypothetical protein
MDSIRMTAGFYKFDTILLWGPNFVESPTYALYKENKDDYTYPVDGWYWFESLEEAQNFFGIEPEEESETII